MTNPTAQPAKCALDGPAFRIREDEFRDLFGRALLSSESFDARSARFVLDATSEAELRDLVARETGCCSFFDFEIAPRNEVIILTARVPNGSEDALDFLRALADDASDAPRS